MAELPTIPEIKDGVIPDEVRRAFDPRYREPAIGNLWNYPRNMSDNIFGAAPTNNVRASEIITKAKTTYNLSDREADALARAYDDVTVSTNLSNRIAQALIQSQPQRMEARELDARDEAARLKQIADQAEAARLKQIADQAEAARLKQIADEAEAARLKREREATPPVAPPPAPPPVATETEAEKAARLKREQDAAAAATATAAPPAPPPTPSPFYTVGELRSAINDKKGPIYDDLRKRQEDAFDQRAADIRATKRGEQLRRAAHLMFDRNGYVDSELARLHNGLEGKPNDAASEVPRVAPRATPPAPEIATAPVITRAPVITPGDADTAAVAERLAREQREREAAPPPAALPTAPPPVATEPRTIPQVTAPPIAPPVAAPPVALPPAPERVEPPSAPPLAPPPVSTRQRPTSVYDQFKDNLARAVGTTGEADVYRAAQEFGKAHTAALRGKGLHLSPDERKKFQEFLFDYGYYQGQRTREQFVDGDFGPETHLAARNLQKTTFEAQQQLSANSEGRKLKDGILGLETARLFEQRAAPVSA